MTENDRIETQWAGLDVYDLNGEKIGEAEGVRPGRVGDTSWLVIKTGLLGTKKVFVPASEVRASHDRLSLPFTKERVKDSPQFEDNETFTEAEEGKLCRFFGLQYVGSAGGSEEGCAGLRDSQDYRAAG